MPIRRVPAKRSPYYTPPCASASFSIGTETANVITVRVTLLDQVGAAIAYRGHVGWFLSADANGDAKAAAAQGGVASGTNGHVTSTTTGIAGWAVTETDGTFDIAISDNTVRSVYLVILLPDGTLKASSIITWA